MWKFRLHSNKAITLVAAAILVSFSFLAIFGLSLSMTTDEHGTMSGCPFMSHAEVVCQMQIGEHIAKWQHAVTGIPQKFMSVALVALLMLASWHFISRFLFRESTALVSAFVWLRRRRRLHALFDFLHQAFSQGILHPKIYEGSSV